MPVVAIYARLSVNEKGERDESLETQCQLLRDYVEKNGLGSFKFYIDNDISGACFDRPGLIKLVNDINSGIVKVIVVKDLSRLGRNNGETLTFLDFLEEKKVRLISLGDNYDSFRDDDEIIGIKTWVNEHYARDISKKVRYNLRKKMQNGEFLGRPPFGYLKSSREKNKLVVDERYREVIQKIFELYIEGWGYRALAGYVQELGVPTPSQDKGYLYAPKSQRWNEQHIRRIITNRVYCGDSVQGVSEKISFKSKKTRRVDSEKWIVVPGTHEAIISRETFELAQRVRVKRWLEGQGRKKSKRAGPHLFTGFIVCARCGSHHIYRKKGNRPAGYICGLYNRLGRKACTSHHVSEKGLISYIIQDIQSMAGGISFRDQLIREYEKDNNKDDNHKKIKKLRDEIASRKRQLQMAYLDKVRGIISGELFLEINSFLEKEIAFLSGCLDKLKTEWAEVQKTSEDIYQKINDIGLDLLDNGDIDRIFLEQFLKKIIVVESGEKINEKVMEKYGLETILSKEQLKKIGQKKGLIILYNVRSV